MTEQEKIRIEELKKRFDPNELPPNSAFYAIPWLISLCEKLDAQQSGLAESLVKQTELVAKQESQIAMLKEVLEWISKNSGHSLSCPKKDWYTVCEGGCDVQFKANEALANLKDTG